MTRAFVICLLSFSLSIFAQPTSAEPPPLQWSQSETSVGLVQGQTVLWQFNHGPSLNVPYFHPVSTPGGQVLTWDRPPDHAWHHGLWFCWKYINRVNYWEHDRQTGKPVGRTEWSDLRTQLRDDHFATISLTLTYRGPEDDQVVLSERRSILISAPSPQGEFHFDWTSQFTAGDEQVELDRTPPKEQSWGGYAGLSVRFAKDLLERQATSSTGPAEFGSGDRYRNRGTAMDYSGVSNARAVGLAFLDHPDNPRHPTPWYVIRSRVMSYVNAALLHDEPMILKPGERMTLRYRLIVHPHRWDAARLQSAQTSFWQSVSPAGE